MAMIHKFVTVLGLKGDCLVDLLNDRHILIRPMMEKDFTRLWCKHVWYLMNKPMTLSKWIIDLRPNQESSLTPIWVTFPDFPLPFFDKEYLYNLSNLIGHLYR